MTAKLNILAALISFVCGPAWTNPVEHLEPPSWWVGMKQPVLQLMVHGPRISDYTPTVDYSGVSIHVVRRTENPNYYFIILRIGSEAKAGTLELVFERDGERFSQPFELAARSPGSAEREGFGPADVIYLITPDRFANGDPDNDAVDSLAEGPDRGDPDGRHGGDLQGIIDRLDYIAEMGFTQIWLNPVRENNQPRTSYHGYAITDLYKVDARYGDNALYRTLAAEARKRGIGLIQDVIPNHIGSEHWWMADPPSPDWINHQGTFSPTNHQRESLHDPHRADADRAAFSDGWFVPTMPDLNQRNPFMANYLIQNSLWWIEYAGLSGLRVDTYSYSDPAFLSAWTRRLISEYPNLTMVGEEWSLNPTVVSYWQHGTRRHDDYQSWLPSLMDFPLQDALVRALTEPESWGTGLLRLYQTMANDFQYGDPSKLVVFADNHDMSRTYTQLGEDDALWRMAMAYLATTRGIPQIFYGTEVLMSNPQTDAHGVIRSDFPGGWPGDPVNAFTGEGLSNRARGAQAWLRKLLNWRKGAPAVTAGTLTHYVRADGVYVYFRIHPQQRIMVAMNKTNESARLDSARFRDSIGAAVSAADVLTGHSYNLSEAIDLPAMTTSIFELQ